MTTGSDASCGFKTGKSQEEGYCIGRNVVMTDVDGCGFLSSGDMCMCAFHIVLLCSIQLHDFLHSPNVSL